MIVDTSKSLVARLLGLLHELLDLPAIRQQLRQDARQEDAWNRLLKSESAAVRHLRPVRYIGQTHVVRMTLRAVA